MAVGFWQSFLVDMFQTTLKGLITLMDSVWPDRADIFRPQVDFAAHDMLVSKKEKKKKNLGEIMLARFTNCSYKKGFYWSFVLQVPFFFPWQSWWHCLCLMFAVPCLPLGALWPVFFSQLMDHKNVPLEKTCCSSKRPICEGNGLVIQGTV